MKVSYYCQHVLGIGHYRRSLAICEAISRRHPTTLIVGGPPIDVKNSVSRLVRLPGLQMDGEFNSMTPCDSSRSLEEVKQARKELLFSHFQHDTPDVFITELYPFGRKAFRFELDPVLIGIRDGSLSDCQVYCSVRDILVEKKTGREKFEERVVKTLNSYYDGILVHADPTIITLNETFSRMADISIPLQYTGFVTQPAECHDRNPIRSPLNLGPEDRLIVASIGGGSVGSELLYSAIAAFKLLQDDQKNHLQLFCGPYCGAPIFADLQKRCRGNISIERFTDNFPAWLNAADLSISMAGYNTCMNLVQAGIPALVYPFSQNREQVMRAERLAKKTMLKVLDVGELAPVRLARHMARAINMARNVNPIDTDGAQKTVDQLDVWMSSHRYHDH
ncbi:MAG: glycosyltransferase family protein [Desulforhopalus sp.]